MSRRLLAAIAATVVAIVVVLTAPVTAGAVAHPEAVSVQQDDRPSPETTEDAPGDTTEPTGAPTPDIIPKPNSGREPQEAGDRGGALQLGLLALIVLAVGGGIAKLVHDSRRSRKAAADAHDVGTR